MEDTGCTKTKQGRGGEGRENKKMITWPETREEKRKQAKKNTI